MPRSLLLALALLAGVAVHAQTLTPTARGVVAETDRYRVEFRDGVLVGLLNKLTGEPYIDAGADAAALTAHLPAGIGTQHAEAEREAAFAMYHAPWAEHDVTRTWPNQHRPTAASSFRVEPMADERKALGVRGAYTWTGLTNGAGEVFADEVYGLELTIDGATGDLLVTPFGSSPRPGVYGAMVTLNALLPAVTVEAPIFDGIRLDRHMPEQLWQVMWANYWDYGFIALNGHRTGAVGIWAQDAELRTYKHLFHMTRDGSLSLALGAMNVPPFDALTETRPFTWRLQAFDRSWAQAAARYRQWRDANLDIVPRPEWARHISFVNSSVNGSEMWLKHLRQFVGDANLKHTLSFLPDIRRAGFDKNHADNAPYSDFPAQTQAWRDANARFMVYLNPVIMWGPTPTNEREEAGPKLATEARTIFPFQAPGSGPVPHFDVQHLGHPGWQDWFVAWINDYLQTYGATGIYHDEGQKTPLDGRGPINGMTAPQGRAAYMRRVLRENPDTIHGVEHMTEVNLPGASVGIGSGVHWGTALGMRRQRIYHASPVSNALGYPHAVTWAFPHQSQLTSKGESRTFHWGLNLQERRGDIAGLALQGPIGQIPTVLPYATWRGDMWVEYRRARLFVEHGLRPVFPEDYARDTLTYFDGDDGTRFRYRAHPWGFAFVQDAPDGSTALRYARLTGAATASVAGSIAGWPVYNAAGPAGLLADRFYVLDPEAARPAVYFEPANEDTHNFYEGAVYDGYLHPRLAVLQLDSRPDIGRIQPYDSTILHSPTPPYRVWINGELAFDRDTLQGVDWSSAETLAATYTVAGYPAVGPRVLRTWREQVEGKNVQRREFAAGQWQIRFQLPAQIAVLLEKPAAGFDAPEAQGVLRIIAKDHHLDLFDPAASSALLERRGEHGLGLQRPATNALRPFRRELLLPLAPPVASAGGRLQLVISAPADRGQSLDRVAVNGVDQQVAVSTVVQEDGKRTVKLLRCELDLPLAAGDAALLTVTGSADFAVQLLWHEAPAEAPAEPKN